MAVEISNALEIGHERRPPSSDLHMALFGRHDDTGGSPALINADLFQRKFRLLIKALRAADESVNSPRNRHSYYIKRLATGSITADIIERPTSSKSRPSNSSTSALCEFADLIYRGKFSAATRFGRVIEPLKSLCYGAGELFSFLEIKSGDYEARLDAFTTKQAERYSSENNSQSAASIFFQGESREGFDGRIRLIDNRGSHPSGKFILNVGGVEIDAILRLSLEEERFAFDRRVWAEGAAIYTGRSALPDRFVIDRIEAISESSDINRWRGALKRTRRSEWVDI